MIVESFVASGVIGTAIGGIGRLVVAYLSGKEKQQERDHEYRMFKLEVEQSSNPIAKEIVAREIDVDTTTLSTILEMNKAQTHTGNKLIDKISALVRPTITYWFMGLYTAIKIVFMVYGMANGADWHEAFMAMWDENDAALFSAILGFWFVGRELVKRTKL